jgi:macrolide transport system ATP-binding/permease protein
MDRWVQDFRLATRSLIRSPLLVFVVVLSLGLGIGANTTIYSLANALMLRPIPAVHPEELVGAYTSESSGERYGFSAYPAYVQMRDQNDALQSLAAYGVLPMSVTFDGASHRVLGALVSGNYFATLGRGTRLGRPLVASDDAKSAPPVAVISHGLWTRRFGSDPRMIGATLPVNGHAFQIVGVLGEDFRSAMMGVTPDVFVPLSATPLAGSGSNGIEHRGDRWLFLLGRLAPGQRIDAAQSRMDAIARAMAIDHPQSDSARVVSLLPESAGRIHPRVKGPVTAFMALLGVVVILVLAVACANVAGVLLARAVTRRRDVGVRLALGASRGRILSQFLIESLMLAALGGAVGWALASWGTDLLLAFKPPLPIDVTLDLRPDGRVLLFTLALSTVTGLLFGMVPALEALRVDPGPAIHGGAAAGGRRSRLRSSLVVGQVAVSLLLLIGAGLMLRGLDRAARLDPGFEVDHTLAMSFDLELAGYDSARVATFYGDVLERVRGVRGVEAAALDEQLPLGFGSQRTGLAIEGRTADPHENLEIDSDVVSAGYFDALRIPIVNGREFLSTDRPGAPRVAIVNQAFARRFWPGQNAIGRRITMDMSGRSGWMEVVGMARDVSVRGLADDPVPFFYLPSSQVQGPRMTLVARVSGDPGRASPRIRDAVRSLDPGLPIFDAKTMSEHLGITLYPARLASTVLGFLGALALALAAIGLYGVVAFAVTQRTREIGVRMAVGASPGDVLRLVIRHGMRLAMIGLVIGLALAIAATRLIGSLLFGLSPTDPITLAAIALLLVLVTGLASWIPARRAARVDPMIALRHE